MCEYMNPHGSTPTSPLALKLRSGEARKTYSPRCFDKESRNEKVSRIDDSDPVDILPYLYLGSEVHASRSDVLQRLGITSIINVSRNIPNSFQGDFEYKNIPIDDTYNADIECWFEEAVQFIDNVKNSGGRVFVHCQAGISRSATICLAYLISRQRFRLDEAYEFVKKRRPDDQFPETFAFVEKHTNNTLQTYHNTLKTYHNTLQTYHNTLQTYHNTLQTYHNTLQTYHNTVQTYHNTLQTHHNTLQTYHNTLQTYHNTLQTYHNTLQPYHNTLQTYHNTLQTYHNTLQPYHNTLQTYHNTLQTYHNTLQTYHNTLQTYHNTLQTYHNTLQTYHNTLQTYHNTSQTYHNPLQTYHNTLQPYHNTLQTYHNTLQTHHVERLCMPWMYI
ncbi:hypothetical protein QZH41_000071 [Actinostola sp. cb2023]|nr:hypothetical protein QZH41_000071 [Actinostola sp. cb2023]